MAPRFASVRTDREVNHGQSQVGLPMIGAARTDRALTDIQLADGDWILALVKRAQEETIKQAAAVRQMGMAKTQYIENLQGVGHLSIRRLGLLDESFWLALADGIREHFRIDNDAERLARALDVRAAADKVIDEIARKGATK